MLEEEEVGLIRCKKIRPRLKRCATNQARLDSLRNILGQTQFGLIRCATFQAKLSQMVGGAGKNRGFEVFLPDFCPV